MPPLLSTTNRRADQCRAFTEVSGGDAWLKCNLKRDHPGPLHFDSIDGIWWVGEGPVT